MRRKKPCPYVDLFGEIPVTWPEVEAWVLATVGLSPQSPRFRYYVTWWNVPEKIRAAKREGYWPPEG